MLSVLIESWVGDNLLVWTVYVISASKLYTRIKDMGYNSGKQSHWNPKEEWADRKSKLSEVQFKISTVTED